MVINELQNEEEERNMARTVAMTSQRARHDVGSSTKDNLENVVEYWIHTYPINHPLLVWT